MIIVDTGALIAYLNPKDSHHIWAASRIKILPAPLITCEAVLTETLFLASRNPYGIQRVFELMERGAMVIAFSVSDHLHAIQSFMSRYRNLPMSLADACLVQLAEMHPSAQVLTVDSHFRIYRHGGGGAIPVIMPD